MATGAEISFAAAAALKLGDYLAGWAIGKGADRGTSFLGDKLRNRADRKAFNAALEQACGQLEEDEPELAASFFDKHFFETTGSDELKKLLSAEDRPSAQALAEAFKQHALTSTRLPELESRCGKFLEQLETAMRDQPVLWPIFDRRDQRSLTRAAEQLARSVPGDAPQYRGAIRQFVEIYLGTDTAPEPFGGRDADFLALNNWLADRQAQDRMLVTAPAGRGKTALLVRWTKQLPEHLGVKIVFVPIRADLGTADPRVFYSAFSSRIADAMADKGLSEQWPLDREDPESHRDRIDGLLSSYKRAIHGPMLIVIDGLDELPADEKYRLNSLLPKSPQPGLHFLVSARLEVGNNDASAWERKLGWQGLCDCHEPKPLDNFGIRDVLVQFEAPKRQIADNPDIVDHLVDLTDGDPLLVNLYVKALWKEMPETSRLRPEDLADLKPGLSGYFHDWISRQQRLWRMEDPPLDPTNDLSSMLAIAIVGQAMGPLLAMEIAAILELVEGRKPASVLRLLKPFAAFLRGDGTASGYTFNHPRLADFFGGGRRLSEERWEYLEDHIVADATNSTLR